MRSKKIYLSLLLMLGASSMHVHALFLDGNGFYSLGLVSETAPMGGLGSYGLHQAGEHDLKLGLEARASEASSFFLDLRLNQPFGEHYLGDQARSRSCPANTACKDNQQNSQAPGYKPFLPAITKVFARYSMEYCILEAGRRPKDWGMGILYDAGNAPFSRGSSLFDGVSCHVNMQKYQNISFGLSFDKLAETGQNLPSDTGTLNSFGPTNKSDDLTQYNFYLQWKDNQNQDSYSFGKQIGMLLSYIDAPNSGPGAYNSDLYFIDFYLALHYSAFVWQNEFLIRKGRTSDPTAALYGGALYDQTDAARNNLQAMGLLSSFEWLIHSSGAIIGPEEYKQGNLSKHILQMSFAHAPGDAYGYYSAPSTGSPISIYKRHNQATALPFHENFKPTLILFNGRQYLNALKVDGVFDPQRFMNAQMYSLEYRYEDLKLGNFETKLSYARLLESIPDDVHDYYMTQKDKVVGFYGQNLGLELDLKYSYPLDFRTSVAVAAGALFSGDALKANANDHNPTDYIVQSYITFNF